MTLYDGSVVTLERSTLEKDLGILIDCELKFFDHMFAATKKANGIMGVIRRTFTHLDLKCFSLLYKGDRVLIGRARGSRKVEKVYRQREWECRMMECVNGINVFKN